MGLIVLVGATGKRIEDKVVAREFIAVYVNGTNRIKLDTTPLSGASFVMYDPDGREHIWLAVLPHAHIPSLAFSDKNHKAIWSALRHQHQA